METAIAYIRVSDQRQVIDGNSLVTQERTVRGHANQRSYKLDHIFVEPGESAKTDHRPALQEMLKYCTANKGRIAVLIVPKIDRLARNTYDYTGLKVRLLQLGIRIESVGERIEDTPVGRFTETILASVAQFDNEIRAERCKGGMIQAVREGRWVFMAPFGYRNTRHNGKATIEPDPKRASIVAQIYKRLERGHRPSEVRAWLNESGYPISDSYFFKIVRNPLYRGEIHSFGEINHAAPPFVPLVTSATFTNAQRAFRKVTPAVHDRDNPAFPLRGTLKCVCGHLLTASWSKGKYKRYAHYRCMHCRCVNHPRDRLHADFIALMQSLRISGRAWQTLSVRLAHYAGSLKQESATARSKALKDLTSHQEMRRAIGRKNTRGVLPDDLALEQIRELDAKIAACHERLDRLSTPESDFQDALRFGEHFFSCLDQYWDGASNAAKKMLQRFAFPNGVTVERSGEIRTPESHSLTGLQLLSRDRECRVVDPHRHTPKTSGTTDEDTLTEVGLSLLLDIHVRFGDKSEDCYL
ncbi:MAG: recombinase family protein [Fimbriimonadaceae bacterium]|nr:recombinase family protein [Fimbriimonadaceae bacterium]QYK59121.1 MAG: recombinase family protein [Fimbriimonadaceae bacterium]